MQKSTEGASISALNAEQGAFELLEALRVVPRFSPVETLLVPVRGEKVREQTGGCGNEAIPVCLLESSVEGIREPFLGLQ